MKHRADDWYSSVMKKGSRKGNLRNALKKAARESKVELAERGAGN